MCNGRGDHGCFTHRSHVVNPQNLGAPENGRRDRAGCTVNALLHRLVDDAANKGFAGDTDQERMAKLGQHIQFREQLKIMLFELTKTDAWVKHDLLRLDAQSDGSRRTLAKKIRHLSGDIYVRWIPLHGLGNPLHMHQDRPDPSFRNQGRHARILPKCAHVVHDDRASLDGLTRDA
ncbi:MAG: hypothetical protein U0361_04170 [Nitrospiraceae bacterium]